VPIQKGDHLTITKNSVPIFEKIGGHPDPSYLTRNDIRNDAIVVQEVKTHGGQTWYRVRISEVRPHARFKMPDTEGWLRASDVQRVAKAKPKPVHKP
jgi:hypothetical protein